MTDTPSIVNETEVEWEDESQGESFAYRRKALASAANGEKLGCSLYEVPPGKRPFPYHYHTANEEAIFVLSGNGTLKTQGETLEITVGDYVVLPVGEPGARQIINTTVRRIGSIRITRPAHAHQIPPRRRRNGLLGRRRRMTPLSIPVS